MNKKAMAIEIVLIFAAIMGVLGLFLLRTSGNNNRQLETSMDQLQSYYIARAGVEHAMLKIKFLNREFYDAICLAQGRNPLFNYTGISIAEPYNSICATNPGPIFLYTAGAPYTRTGVYTEGIPEADKWINVFKEDVKSDGTVSNTCLSMMDLEAGIKEVMSPVDTVSGTGAAYAGFNKAIYLLDDIDFGAYEVSQTASGRVDNTIAVNFTIKSSYISSKNNTYDCAISRTVTVSREL